MLKINQKKLFTLFILGGIFLAACVNPSKQLNTFVCNPPCGPLPNGRNSCLTIPDSIYTSCKKDSDCSQGESCQLLQCHSGDVIIKEKQGCVAPD